MRNFIKALILIQLLLISSCEKQEINDNENQLTEISKGTITATTTYVGSELTMLKRCNYYICDINQLDLIMTLTQQAHEARMNGNYEVGLSLYNTLINSIQPIYKTSNNNFQFSYDIVPGTYIVMAERYVHYDYSNIYPEKTDSFGSVTSKFLYKVIQVESNQTSSVAFVFQDYKPL